MAEDTSAPPLQLIEADVDGYCDPATGACVWPGAANAAADYAEPRSKPAENSGE